ncbi:hypothetical protein DB88DRAFT_471188 [Papiliotrema laurentii]|uniref:Uncharacterized protein n=1 Tax=Papiliotrema laurentii TaxID=5418 RepID=A0AAD9L800_PAPLA|nr:hypothetical protein DB88DRAFT_471188 [Papiliotrema laurentii]
MQWSMRCFGSFRGGSRAVSSCTHPPPRPFLPRGSIFGCIGGEMSPPRGSDHRTVNRHSIAWWIGRPDTPWQTSRRLLLGDLKPIDFILTILVTISQQSQCTGGMHTMLAYC